MQEKQRCMILLVFNFLKAFLISSAGSFLASKRSLWEKYCNYPLTTTQGDLFASCENIVSRSQTSSLPPPPPAWNVLYFCLLNDIVDQSNILPNVSAFHKASSDTTPAQPHLLLHLHLHLHLQTFPHAN